MQHKHAQILEFPSMFIVLNYTDLEPRTRVSEAHCLSLYLLSRYVHLVLLWRLLVHANGDANLIHCLTPRPMVENAATLNSLSLSGSCCSKADW